MDATPRIPETCLASAYEKTGGRVRALIKQEIARLFQVYPSVGNIRIRETQNPDNGYSVRVTRKPLEKLIVNIGAGFVSYPRLLALMVPAICGGIMDIQVFLREGKDADASILAALELCGVEEIFAGTGMSSCLDSPVDSGELLALFGEIGKEGLPARESGKRRAENVWQEPGGMRAGVWMEYAQQWDMRALTRLHPDMDIHVYSPGGLTDYPSLHAEPQDFMDMDFDVVYVPENMLDWCTKAWLVLAPGMENAWMWPHISRYLEWETVAASTSGSNDTGSKDGQIIDKG